MPDLIATVHMIIWAKQIKADQTMGRYVDREKSKSHLK